MSSSPAAPNAWQLQSVIALAQATLESLRVEHGQIIETDESLLAALTGEGISVDDIIRRLTRAALDSKASVAAANERIDDLVARRDRFKRHEAAFRSTALQVMQSLGLRQFSDPEFHISVRPGIAKLILTDEDALTEDYTQTVTAVLPDKVAIRAALDAGHVVPGATLSNPAPSITIRSR